MLPLRRPSAFPWATVRLSSASPSERVHGVPHVGDGVRGLDYSPLLRGLWRRVRPLLDF